MNGKTGLLAGVAVVGAIAVAYGVYRADRPASVPWSVPMSVPMGVTIVDVVTPTSQFLWQRLGDANGKALYTYNEDKPGESSCVDDCAKEFPPFLADAAAVAEGDWSIVTRADGARQWAYQGQPLYSYSGEDPPDAKSDGSPLGGSKAKDETLFDPGSQHYSPMDGWRRAAFTPEKTMTIPSGIRLRSHAIANGHLLVTADTGMVIYALSAAPRENTEFWVPVNAPGLAVPAGDFSVVTRASDGGRQWAYKGRLLYTFKGDYSSSDLNGVRAGQDVHPALAYANFMPDSVHIEFVETRGPIMMTKEGLTLYTQLGYRLQYGGRLSRDGYSYAYADAKHVGTAGCVDACAETWRPYLAPADAKPSGFWEIETREDGARQWAYKGAPLYTYVADKMAGDLKGNNKYDIVYGDIDGTVDLTLTTGIKPGDEADSSSRAGSGFYWRAAALVN